MAVGQVPDEFELIKRDLGSGFVGRLSLEREEEYADDS
jgi:hypothetical protein